jgi:hypothetical protein
MFNKNVQTSAIANILPAAPHSNSRERASLYPIVTDGHGPIGPKFPQIVTKAETASPLVFFVDTPCNPQHDRIIDS